LDAPNDLRLERFGRPEVVEADVEHKPDLARDDVRRRVANVDADHFEVRRLEVGVALVERGEQRRENGGERPDRIVGDVRVGDMALAAVQDEPPGQRSAPAVLDRVAERLDAGRLADDTMIEAFASGERPADQLDRAIDGRAFLVAGDEEADRPPKCPPGDEAQGGRRGRREPALHIAGAASPENGPNRQADPSPGGTTSVCPAKTRFGAAVPYRA